jgi:hypothetical protein
MEVWDDSAAPRPGDYEAGFKTLVLQDTDGDGLAEVAMAWIALGGRVIK